MTAQAYGRLRRFETHVPPGNPKVTAPGHPAAEQGRTIYGKRVAHPDRLARLLKSGHHSRKIGGTVVKGRWRGMPVFTLTLEERATCPRTCAHWRDCYGNKMNWSVRIAHGPELIRRLDGELAALQAEHPAGFVVRLHVLGDFWSVAYARWWVAALDRYPALRVYGYTAWPAGTWIGDFIRDASGRLWDRFAVRTSDGGFADRATETVDGFCDATGPASPTAIVCPAQRDRTDCCATCALCWQTTRNIAFLRH